MAKNIRDLLAGPPHPSEATTLQTLAAESCPEGISYPDTEAAWGARMPGDEGEHPLGKTGSNPFPGKNVQELARELNSGKLSREEAKAVHVYLDQFRRLTGQAVYDGRNHVPDFPVEQQYVNEETTGPRLSDSFDSGRNYKWGGHRVR